MRDEGVVLLGKPIDNSRVVRQVDPRSRREIWLLIVLVAVLAAGLGLYAWPALEIRRAGQAGVDLDREKERLLEENRKLQLEKAALENLRPGRGDRARGPRPRRPRPRAVGRGRGRAPAAAGREGRRRGRAPPRGAAAPSSPEVRP